MNILLNIIISLVISVAVPLGIFEIKEESKTPPLTPVEIRKLVKVEASQILELQRATEEELGTQLAALSTFFLSGAGVSSTANDITLTSLTLPQSGQRLNASDLAESNELFYLTLEPGNRSRQEIVACSSVTHNSGGTATLGGCSRGLSPISPYTASTTLRFAHGGGTQVVFSDPPQVFNQFAALNNENLITGEYSFYTGGIFFASDTPYYTTHPSFSSSTQLIDKKYADDLAITGAPVAASSTTGVTGIVRIADSIEAASTSPFTNHGTTSPVVISTLMTFSDPLECLDTSTTSYCVPVTRSNGKIDENYIATSAPYFWGGSHIFDLNGAASSTQEAQTGLALTVDGNSLFTGTTTMGAIISTSTSIQIAGIPYEFPQVQGVASTTLFNRGSNKLAWTSSNPLANIAWPRLVAWATTTSEQQHNTNTNMLTAAYNFEQEVKLRSCSFYVKAVGTSGTLDITSYSEDGQTQDFSVTTGSISATGVITTTISGVIMRPGVHWIGVNSNSTADITIEGYTNSISPLDRDIAGRPDLIGLVTISAGAPAATINPVSDLAATGQDPVMIRCDN